jgi:hypothetical protein
MAEPEDLLGHIDPKQHPAVSPCVGPDFISSALIAARVHYTVDRADGNRIRLKKQVLKWGLVSRAEQRGVREPVENSSNVVRGHLFDAQLHRSPQRSPVCASKRKLEFQTET